MENLLEKVDNLDNKCRRCDSGLSTADNSVGEESSHSYKHSKKTIQRMCSCQYYKESCTVCSGGSSSGGSNQDNTENQQDSIIEEGSDRYNKRQVTQLMIYLIILIIINSVIAATTLRMIHTWRNEGKFHQSLQTITFTAMLLPLICHRMLYTTTWNQKHKSSHVKSLKQAITKSGFFITGPLVTLLTK